MHTWPVMPNALMLSVLWSVAVEEQFYLSWPLILSLVPVRKFKWVFPTIMLFSLVFRSFYNTSPEEVYAVRYFHTFSVIGDMALGGLFAYLTSYENKFKQFITQMNRLTILLIYLFAIGLFLFKHLIFTCGIPIIFERLFIGIAFGLIILEQCFARHSFFKMRQFKLLSKLGMYTYGLYCLHLLGMYLVAKIIVAAQLDQHSLLVAVGSVLVALVFSILIAWISFHFFEKWFLNWKDRFAVIVKE
jgi:peptidoglycan/LPS O-acetylase OafA/YrhL